MEWGVDVDGRASAYSLRIYYTIGSDPHSKIWMNIFIPHIPYTTNGGSVKRIMKNKIVEEMC
jgi:hypothetical protein